MFVYRTKAVSSETLQLPNPKVSEIGCAVATAGCNGLCDPVGTVPRLHQDPNCTKTDTGDLAMMESGYDFGPVGCVKVDDNGNVNKTLCFELE